MHAFFLEELSATGRTVIHELVVEKVGPIDAYLASFEREQGPLVAAIPVRGCEVGGASATWGRLVLTTNGIGYVPEGSEQSLMSELVTEVASFGADFISRGLVTATAQLVDSAHVRGAARSASRPNALPLPLLASIDAGAAWFARAEIQELWWCADTCEVICGGERALCASPAVDADEVVEAWAEANQIALVAIDRAPFTR